MEKENFESFVLFLDNLTGQQANEFKKPISELNSIAWYDLPGATYMWQLVNAGYAQLLKIQFDHQDRNWLDDEYNANRWFANENPFSAME